MNYLRLGRTLLVALAIMVLAFSLSLEKGESLYLVHYFWMLSVAGIIIWREKRKSEKEKIIGNPVQQ